MLELRNESDNYKMVWSVLVTYLHKKIALSTVVVTSLFLDALVDQFNSIIQLKNTIVTMRGEKDPKSKSRA